MKWTIGMPAYDNFEEVYFTVQSLRLHHDLTDCEIVVVDNYGDDRLRDFCSTQGGDTVVYDRMTTRGCSPAKNRVFEIARGEYVLIIDSHVLLKAGTLDHTPPGDDLQQGVMLRNDFTEYLVEWAPIWCGRMWGMWTDPVKPEDLPSEPWESWGTGAGFFACRRDSWLGFNPGFRGFGGETGYIQEKYRQAGRKVWIHPGMVWTHFFGKDGRKIPFPLEGQERIRNYLLGFQELGLDTAPIYRQFGRQVVSLVETTL